MALELSELFRAAQSCSDRGGGTASLKLTTHYQTTVHAVTLEESQKRSLAILGAAKTCFYVLTQTGEGAGKNYSTAEIKRKITA